LDRNEWRGMARRAIEYYASRLRRSPVAMPQMLVAMDLEMATPRHVVIAGRSDAEDTRSMVDTFNRRFLPHDYLLLAPEGDARHRLAKLAPFVAALGPKNGRATAYVCVGYACRLPTTDLNAFAAQLDESPHAKSLGARR